MFGCHQTGLHDEVVPRTQEDLHLLQIGGMHKHGKGYIIFKRLTLLLLSLDLSHGDFRTVKLGNGNGVFETE